MQYTFRSVPLPVADTVPQRMRASAARYADEPCQKWRADDSVASCSYRDFWADVVSLASALKASGIRRAEHVGIISDNRREWLRIDLALLSLGAIDVPRGADTTEDEIVYILRHADCRTVFAENARMVNKIFARSLEIPSLKRVIVIDALDVQLGRRGEISVESYADLMEEGKKAGPELRSSIDAEIDQGKPEDVATIIYTSGTTGEPKGVLLPHRSFIFQVDNIYNYLHVHSWDVVLVVLPVWHAYERACEYIMLERGLSIVHSKPAGSVLMADMALFRPTLLPVVPRLMEVVMQAVQRSVNKSGGLKKALFSFFMGVGAAWAVSRNKVRGWIPGFERKRNRFLDILTGTAGLVVLAFWKLLGNLLVFKTIKQKFGGRFNMAIVGGGALPRNVDDFFQAVGIKCLEGYGLTETGPVLSVRQEHRPVVGTIGPIFSTVEYQVRDDSGKALGPGQKGILFIKSVQNMLGYYKKDEETARVLTPDGWLNTGDLAMYSHGKEPCIRILGRIKDTIVLRGGKNVEPEPLEQRLNASPLVEQSMVVGQDQKFLGAIIVPSQEGLSAWAAERGLDASDRAALLQREEVRSLYQELAFELTGPQHGFKSYERISRVALQDKPFDPVLEMTQTLKIKRFVVCQTHAKTIAALFE